MNWNGLMELNIILQPGVAMVECAEWAQTRSLSQESVGGMLDEPAKKKKCPGKLFWGVTRYRFGKKKPQN